MSKSLPPYKDPAGASTLETISKATAFNEWMYRNIAPYIQSPVLEIGSGLGNISSSLLQHHANVMLSDIDPGYTHYLRKKFADAPQVFGIQNIDLADPAFQQTNNSLRSHFRSVVYLNVLEHIEDDKTAVLNSASMLSPGGHLIILVPAFPFLYSRFDKEIGHCRRYTKHSLLHLISACGLETVHWQYFNTTGIAGWLVFQKWMGRPAISDNLMGLYNTLMPLNRIIDRTFRKIAGLSLIIVARKTEE